MLDEINAIQMLIEQSHFLIEDLPPNIGGNLISWKSKKQKCCGKI